MHDRHLAHMLCDCCDLLHANIFFSAQLAVKQISEQQAEYGGGRFIMVVVIEKNPMITMKKIQKDRNLNFT